MIHGFRATLIPLGIGLITSLLFALLFINNNNNESFHHPTVLQCQVKLGEEGGEEKSNYIYSSEKWKVVVRKLPPSSAQNSNAQVNKAGVIRARFAATELGIREKLIVIVLGQSSLSLAINTYLGQHVPRVHLFVDSSRIDAEMSALPNLTPLRLPSGQHSHMQILNSMFNLTFHENFDFILFVPETTYVNPFALNRLLEQINWNTPLAIGYSNDNGKCSLQGGILLSNPAVQLLIQIHCSALENVISATQLPRLPMNWPWKCAFITLPIFPASIRGYVFGWWREESSETGSAIHDRVSWLATSKQFNSSVTVSPLLSELDAKSLHKHFINVEIDLMTKEIEVATQSLIDFAHSTDNDLSWPEGLPDVAKPPNRYQVAVWEYFNEKFIFKNNPHQNVFQLEGDDALDVQDVIQAARRKIVEEHTKDIDAQFVQLRSGYRVFNALRGMEYVLDLEYRSQLMRVYLIRTIYSTELLNSVPYVKEDTDITLVVGVESLDQVRAAKLLLQRHGQLCSASSSFIDNRQTRVVVGARLVDAAAIREISKHLSELKRRSWHTDTALLLLKPNNGLTIEITAMDEAVDHYGQQMIYVYLSPYADYQREFLDRVRINTIRHYQVFFPIPFAEFNPVITRAETILDASKNLSVNQRIRGSLNARLRYIKRVANANPPAQKALQVHKAFGLFDVNDFTSFSTYGADYVTMRSMLAHKEDEALTSVHLFLGQSQLHLLRAIEPSLSVRWHYRNCEEEQARSGHTEASKCRASERLSLGNKAQLANAVFADLKDGVSKSDETP